MIVFVVRVGSGSKLRELAQLGADVAGLLERARARRTRAAISPGSRIPPGQFGVEAAASLPPLADEDDVLIVSEREHEHDVGTARRRSSRRRRAPREAARCRGGARHHGLSTTSLGGEQIPRPRRGHHRTLAGAGRPPSHVLRRPGVTAHDGSRGDSTVRALLRRALRRGARLPPPPARPAGRGCLAGDLPARPARLRPARARARTCAPGCSRSRPGSRSTSCGAKGAARSASTRRRARRPRADAAPPIERARAPTRRRCRRPSGPRSCSATATTFPTPRSAPRSARPRRRPAPQPRPASAD